MKAKIIFFGSDQYSTIVSERLKKDARFSLIPIGKEHPDVGIIASYGAKIPPKMIKFPRKGILNIHPSLLPLYRGPTPVPTAILNGDKVTGVTIIKIDEMFDHGPIVSQFKEEIKPDDTSESLLTRLFFLGAETLSVILPAYLKDQIRLRPQDHSRATYTKKLTRDGGKIDWKKDPLYLERFIRAMYPWPGAWTEIEFKIRNSELRIKKRLKILKAHLESEMIKDRQPKPSKDRNRLAKLVLDKVQLEGKKPVTWKQFQEGYPQAKLSIDRNLTKGR